MPRELRNRKVASPKNEATKSVEKATPKGKRKAAAEVASPVAAKKQKASKKPEAEAKPAKSPKPKAKEEKKEELKEKKKEKKEEKKEEKKVEKVEEKEDVIEMDDDSDSEGQEGEDNLQVLAVNIDPEEENAVAQEEFQPGQDVGKIPKVSKDVQKSIKASKEEPGVIYIGRIPHGFYEFEMKQYLSQFGPISRLRLSRNKKTGASKHFAFVEFAEASTAEIVAKTMDNYLLFGHILKCKILSKDQVHEDLFKGANRRFKKVPWNKMAGLQLTKPQTESAWEAKVARERNNRAKKAAKLQTLGYSYEAPALKDVPAPVPAAIENGEEAKAIEAAPEAAVEEEKAVEEAEEAEAEEKPLTAAKTKATPVKKAAAKPKTPRSTTKAKKAKA
ncbi:hypothetical protein TGAM01_v205631 [Trichoderma gamsii]|uniref:RRM domain-containing protein n=1 Tax=Trichoderma gamsii TaxID=398673 RepID=A0A2P4ZM16_9HYPO|nr:hypothetical protein TGAM01_v205631 [Trichoderma gamsii]PON25337.1 hypothetical protein TGAM01_v205631 [Trichoderma gamsii]